MGLIKKKPSPPKPPREESFTRLSDPDLVLAVEASLMSASHRMSLYMRSPASDKAALIQWVAADLESAAAACDVLSSRQ